MLKVLLDEGPTQIRVERDGKIRLDGTFKLETGKRKPRGVKFLPLSEWLERSN